MLKSNRYEVASILAAAVLQLHTTPWIPNSWSMDEIYLIGNGGDQSQTKHPYVSTLFASKSGPISQAPQSKNEPAPSHNPIVFALGVMLLELHFGKPLDSFITAEELDARGNQTIQTKHSVAERLATEMEHRELPSYAGMKILLLLLNSAPSSPH